MGIQEGPVPFQMTTKVMVQVLQTTLEICNVNICMVGEGRTFKQDCNDFEGFGEMGSHEIEWCKLMENEVILNK
jgi:hypothetical protein